MSSESRDVLVRTARELLRWDQERLSEASGVKLITLRRFETGSTVRETTVQSLFRALEKAGVVFIGETSIEGVKVREGVAVKPRAQRLARPEPRRRRTKAQIEAERAETERETAVKPALSKKAESSSR